MINTDATWNDLENQLSPCQIKTVLTFGPGPDLSNIQNNFFY